LQRSALAYPNPLSPGGGRLCDPALSWSKFGVLLADQVRCMSVTRSGKSTATASLVRQWRRSSGHWSVCHVTTRWPHFIRT